MDDFSFVQKSKKSRNIFLKKAKKAEYFIFYCDKILTNAD